MKIKSQHVRWASLVIAIVLALPLPWWGQFSGVYMWTSPWLVLLMLLSGGRLAIMSIIALLVMAVIIWRHRWYCKTLCPVGALCDTASKLSRGKPRKIPSMGGILALFGLGAAVFGVSLFGMLDPMTIFHTFFDAFQQSPTIMLIKVSGLVLVVGMNLVFPHIWCQRICPLGGTQDLSTKLKRLLQKKPARQYSGNRRLALGVLAGFGTGFALRRLIKGKTESIIRPPGALPEAELAATCYRCGNCGRACPTNIIKTLFDSNHLASLLTPHVSFTKAYCLPGCTNCGDVCPSGTLRRITPEEKKLMVMGTAKIELTDCLLTKQKECSLCRQFCAYDAVVIKRSPLEFSAKPEIIKDKCVGCGACVIACPVQVITVEVG